MRSGILQKQKQNFQHITLMTEGNCPTLGSKSRAQRYTRFTTGSGFKGGLSRFKKELLNRQVELERKRSNNYKSGIFIKLQFRLSGTVPFIFDFKDDGMYSL